MELIKTLKSKPDNIGEWSWICWRPIHKPWHSFSWHSFSWHSFSWHLLWRYFIEYISSRSTVLNRTRFQFFVNIILNIEKTEILAITWLSFFVGLVFISNSCLFTFTITTWPITPRSTVTWFVAETCAIWNFVRFYCWGRTCKIELAMNLTQGIQF